MPIQKSRLNPNQMRNRARQIATMLGDVVPDQVWEILERAGILEEMRDAGHLTPTTEGAEGTEAPHKPKNEKSLDELLEEAYRGGLERGDPQIIHAYEDKRRKKEAVQAFNVCFRLVPYRIKDASLEQIMLEADERPVMQLLAALVRRSRMDNCPEDLCVQIETTADAWLAWAKTGLKARRRPGEEDYEDLAGEPGMILPVEDETGEPVPHDGEPTPDDIALSGYDFGADDDGLE